MERINIAKLLKDCPKGMELDCTMFDGTVILESINIGDSYPISIRLSNGNLEYLTKTGGFIHEDLAKCVIFPKGKTTWEGFQRPYINGDIVYTIGGSIAILGEKNGEYFNSYCGLFFYESNFDFNGVVLPERLATEEEKEQLFRVIENNGYKWNAETKTLEKLIEPKFKVGDRIRNKTHIRQGNEVTEIKDTHYILDDELALPFISQDDYELVPNKFDINTLKPFDKVLVRHNDDNKWCGSFFSYIDEDFHSHCYKFVTVAGKSYPKMIPYEGNEHLLGKKDDCDEYFKTWK